MLSIIMTALIDILITAAAILVAGRVTAVRLSFKEALTACGASAAVRLIPLIPGFLTWLASIFVLFHYLKKYSRAPVYPDLLLLVVISKFISFALTIGVINLAK
ncbi:hypothetical protein [Algicola sagamiensis]|uniref:hypothetical protein n=1 Tax=Algicola sagamiensis TaxID=163869 RepID=UPI0003732F9D|nr:hypothetical protein [Algicola sagamiensis]